MRVGDEKTMVDLFCKQRLREVAAAVETVSHVFWVEVKKMIIIIESELNNIERDNDEGTKSFKKIRKKKQH